MPSERELMASLGVGRSTIREALNGLAVLGVIEIRHGQGAFVVHTDPATPPGALTASLAKGVTRDLLEARVAVELTIAELASRRRTPADIREIEAILEVHAALLERDEPAAEAAARFHLELAEAAHNEVLAGFIESVMGLLMERGPELELQPWLPGMGVARARGHPRRRAGRRPRARSPRDARAPRSDDAPSLRHGSRLI